VPEVTDALVSQVIALKPDAFIMTGDNTNNGKEEDVKALSEKLRKLKDAGIEVILTTGNHDYGQADKSVWAWEEYILPLLDMEERDPDSYSYMTVNNGVTILAMDDSHPGDSGGRYSEGTMQWLRRQLETAKENGSRVLF
ncbi:MAG: metallophosphoesterase, partial [Erysipelotrichaceae bacterium]|nr:metallophosphoesterase [Erysipelotrichaceae bacterium]